MIIKLSTPLWTVSKFSGLLNLIPEETDDLLQRIDQPLTEETDQATVKLTVIRRIPIWIIDLQSNFFSVLRKYLIINLHENLTLIVKYCQNEIR